jgi:DNA-binding NarL/FixJ family response regulator
MAEPAEMVGPADMATPASCNVDGTLRWQADPVAGVAGTCAEAVQRVEALRPDFVLIDIRLGEESGFDAARQLAANGQAAPMIMISTHAGPDYADLIAESPVSGFLPKAQLSAAAIRRILGTS